MPFVSPVVRLNQHRPSQRAEQLSSSHHFFLNGQEVRAGNDVRVSLWTFTTQLFGKPPACFDDAVHEPATKFDAVGTSPALPVRYVVAVHQRRDDLDLLMRADGSVEVVLLNRV